MKRIGTLLVLVAAGMFTLGAVGCNKTDKTKSPTSTTTTKTDGAKTTKTE